MGTLIDLTGKKFGKLTVVSRAPNDKNGNAMWNCICQCGGEKVAIGSGMARGSVSSCGCAKKDMGKRMIIDIKGKKFGRLTAIEVVGKDNDGNAVWKFRCDCGRYHEAAGKYVREGKSTSCGCRLKELYEENIIDIVGKRFGRLFVIRRLESDDHGYRYECKCSCGNTIITWGAHLRNSHSTSCGCYNRELIVEYATKHGMIDTPEYHCWQNMMQRCNNPNTRGYNNYGGRGIKVCEEWRDFENFYRDMGNIPFDGATIERINNNGDYEKNNCRFATRKDQANNRRDNLNIEYNGETKTLTQWSRELNMSISSLRSRVKKNWPIEKAFTTPVKQYRRKHNAKT